MSKFNKLYSFNRRGFLQILTLAGGAALTPGLCQLKDLSRATASETFKSQDLLNNFNIYPQLKSLTKAKGKAANKSKSLLSDLDNVSQPTRPLKVVILGAGMAGLCAAYELEKRGHTCVILEADRSHIGGRVRTLRFEDGLYGEAGAMRIPKRHDLTHHYIKECGLQLRHFVMGNPEGYYHMRGQRLRVKEVKKLSAVYGLKSTEKQLIPDDVWAMAVDSHVNKISEKEKEEIFAAAIQSAAVRELDEKSLQQLCHAAGFSNDAIEMMSAAYGSLGSEMYFSALGYIRDAGNFSDLEEIVGGSDALPKALAAKLKSQPKLGCEAIRIERDDQGKKAAAIYVENGQTKREEGDFVLCTIPFPVLARIDTPFSPSKQRAIRDWSYDSSTKVLAIANRRFWETDDGIYGGGSFSDLPISTTYYPSDNAKNKDSKVSASPAVMLASYTWGSQARRLGDLSPQERHAQTQQCLSKLHPQINQNGVLRKMVSWSWDNHPWSGGAFTFLMPYLQTSLYKDVIAPEGRIYFAGEHASTEHAWIQGALESALTAVKEILIAAQLG